MNDAESMAATDALINEDAQLILSFVVENEKDSSPLHFISEKLLNTLRQSSAKMRRMAEEALHICDKIDALLAKRPEETPDISEENK
jgi:hypothetical protein